jgi:acetyl esterase
MSRLDPQVQTVFDRYEAAGLAELTFEGSLDELRRKAAPVERELGGALLPVAVRRDETISVGDASIPIRIYGHGGGDEPFLLWIHGGGFILGDLDGCEPVCRALASHSGCAVVAVDYRLAPEHPYPIGLNDCHAVLGQLAQQAPQLGLDADRIAIGGDSAGGNLTAALALLVRDRGGPALRLQLIVEPAVDPAADYPSSREFATGYLLERDAMASMWELYLGDHPRDDPYVAPLRASSLEGLPPAYVVADECDPLRDEARAYVERLREAGVPTSYEELPGLVHGSFGYFGVVDVARDAVTAAAARLAEALRA